MKRNQPYYIARLMQQQDFEYIEFDTKEQEAEEEVWFPLWALMLIIGFVAVSSVLLAFCCSYKHELMKREAERKKRGHVDGNVSDKDMERGLPKKRWDNDYDYKEDYDEYEVEIKSGESEDDATKKDTCEESSEATAHCQRKPAGNRSRANSSQSVEHLKDLGLPEKDMRWQEILAQPRCVLCSKIFDCGEDVTHSNNPKCSHEYHIECLTKYWAKNKTDNCPVCKQTFIVEEHIA